MKTGVLLMICLAWTVPGMAVTLAQDTRWSGELSWTEEVKVPQGVTLTILPNTRVTFVGGGLVVAGRLVVDRARLGGSGWHGVSLKNCDASTRLSDTEISGATTGLRVQGGAPLLTRVTLVNNDVGLELRGRAAGRLSDSRFMQNRKVGLFVKDESTTAVTGCRFTDNGRFGAYIYRSQPQAFSGNRFSGNRVGLMIAYHGTDPVVQDNHFVDNETGLKVDRAARPVLRNNLLRNNRTGIDLYRRSDPQISGNRIEQNRVGVLVAYSSYPQISGNDFVDNALAVKLEYQSSSWEAAKGAAARQSEVSARSAFAGQGMRSVSEAERRVDKLDGTVMAVGNWWGVDGTQELNRVAADGNPSFIHDGRDQPTFDEGGQDYPLDQVVYAPWSDHPHTEEIP